MKRAFAFAFAAALAIAACATLGENGQGDVGLPTAGAGPFRKLAPTEVHGVAPFVLDDATSDYREPAAHVLGETNGAPNVELFVVARATNDGGPPTDVIARTRADDGRTFFGTVADTGHRPQIIVAPTESWEAGGVSGPWFFEERSELYYATAAGIARATLSGGSATDKKVVLSAATASLPGAPRAPSVVRLSSGLLHMFFEAGNAIFEATSADGETFTVVDQDSARPGIDALLAPSAPVDASTLAPGEKPPFDDARVGDPCAFVRTTAAGREQLLVLYTGIDSSGASAIGFASRYGVTGPLSRQPLPVYSIGQGEEAPAVAAWSAGELLYVSQSVSNQTTRSIAAGYSPANLTLPTALPFPTSL
jgi:hypothetical protein